MFEKPQIEICEFDTCYTDWLVESGDNAGGGVVPFSLDEE